MRIVNIALAVAVLASPLAAAAQTAPAAEGKDKKDPNRMVCRTMDTTGSRLGKKKECRTAAEWTEIQAQDRRDIEKYQANRWKSN
jgi:Ni/Co efflux regulator RcnB